MTTTVNFHSDLLNAPVRMVLETDAEPMRYQFGTLYGEAYISEVYLYGVEIGSHLTDSAAAVILGEAESELMAGVEA